MKIQIPKNEYTIAFVRSSGPGGQNVNKKSTKAQLRWNLDDSTVLTPEQKIRVRQVLRVTSDGDILVNVQSERSAAQNEAKAIRKLHELVNVAVEPQEERVPTEPTQGSREQRLDEKKIHSRRKQARRWSGE